MVASSCPPILLNMYNRCIREGVFPKRWKEERLVLVNKGKETRICYQRIGSCACWMQTESFYKRLVTVIQNAGELSNRQYGFLKYRQTVGAVNEVVKYSKGTVLLETLNAFNSARRSDMLEAPKRFY